MDWKQKYSQIKENLNLDSEKDKKSAEVLNRLIHNEESEEKWKEVEKKIVNNIVLVFGNGPSLEKKAQEIKDYHLHKKCVLVAADSAARVLYKEGIIPDILITDLDGGGNVVEKCKERGSTIIMHAHGDNQEKIKKFPSFSDVIGTSQIPKRIGKLKILGFTDGDRAVSLVLKFRARIVGLVGMDFKIEMENNKFQRKKLEIGKGLVQENLLKIPKGTTVLNLSSSKLGIPKISVANFKEIVG